MKILSNADHVRILVILSDQIWQDYEEGKINSIQFTDRINLIKEQINNEIRLPLPEINKIAAKVGYIIIENRNAFGRLKNYSIAKN